METSSTKAQQDTVIPARLNQPKLRWLQQEEALVAILLVIYMIRCIKEMIVNGRLQETFFIDAYAARGIHFKYHKHVLIPQVAAGVLLCLVYSGINKLILPLFTKLTFRETTAYILRRLLLGVFTFLGISWLLALGFNTAHWFAHPWWFNYGRFQVLSRLGYNDQPLQNLFTGLPQALVLVATWSFVFFLRYLFVNYLDRPGAARSYRVLITNQCTLFALVYFTVMAGVLTFWDGGASFRLFYFCIVPATFLVFMVNTYGIFPRKKLTIFWEPKSIGYLVLTSIICTFPFFLLSAPELPQKTFWELLVFLLIQLFITTPISWLIYRERKDRILQLRGVEQELVRSAANLQFLRSQINPHFLFNVLNTLYGTALREQAPATASGIQQLGDMMRFMLHDNQQDLIPLQRETEYLQHYLTLQQLRTQSSPNITLAYSLQEPDCGHSIAPMLLIPFVENAFKHGISLREPSWIKLSLTCNEKAIHFEISNSVHTRTAQDPELKQSGIGLQNVKERLQLLYPGRHQLNINSTEKEFAVRLTLHP